MFPWCSRVSPNVRAHDGRSTNNELLAVTRVQDHAGCTNAYDVVTMSDRDITLSVGRYTAF